MKRRDKFRQLTPAYEGCREERGIATARAFLAVSALVAIWLDPTAPTSSVAVAYSLIAAYAIFSSGTLLWLRLASDVPRRVPVLLHAVDLGLATAITLLTEGSNSPFLVLFLFTVVAAAYRWGFRSALATAAALIGVLGAEAVLVGSTTRLSVNFVPGTFGLIRFVMRAAYLTIAGVPLAYLIEKEKERRAEASVIAHIVGKARRGVRLAETVTWTFADFVEVFRAERAVLVLESKSTDRIFSWTRDASTAAAPNVTEIDRAARASYLFDVAAHTWYASRRHGPRGPFGLLGLDADGRRLARPSLNLPPSFLDSEACGAVLAVTLASEDCSGRLFLMDPHIGVDWEHTLRFAQRLAAEVGASLHEVYLRGRLRSHAQADERKRIACELHDGIVQSLSVAEMQLAVARRQVPDDAPDLDEQLASVQTLLLEEAANLRALMMEGMRSAARIGQTQDDLAAIVARFQGETGIDARFVSDEPRVPLSERAGHEVAQIVQEGLVNVRKHSGARHVLVRATADTGHLNLSIEDDGRGFAFSGRLSQAELDARNDGPATIKERVRALGGEMSVDSTPGAGTRLTMVFPL